MLLGFSPSMHRCEKSSQPDFAMVNGDEILGLLDREPSGNQTDIESHSLM
jgi:hypothetical protein